ncbi:MAG: carbohydrate-binding domain-containing protein [Bacteroidales bacterium]|nr:carbohydrate-binding domain-containing protein [Bacteroidales bacterium]
MGCVFATACGKKNKDSEEESEPHVHAYTELNQGDANGHYYTCPDDGEKGEVTAHTYGAWTTVTAATCGDYGTQERSCTVCGYKETDTTTLAPTGNHTYTSTSKATFDWTNFDEDNLSGVTATVECDVCHKEANADSVTVAAVEETEDTYVATATVGGAEIVSEEHKVGEVAFEELLINIGDLGNASYESDTLLGSSSTASVYATASSSKKATIEEKTGKTDASGRLTFTKWIKFGGAGTVSQCSLKFELAADADITVWMVSSSGSDKRIVNLFTADGETVYQTIGVGSPDSVTGWTVSVPAGTYYMGSASSGLNFFAIEVTEYTGSYTSDTPATTWSVSASCDDTSLVYVADSGEAATTTVAASVLRDNTDVTSSVTLSWSSSDESVATVSGGVVTAVGTGTTEITVSCTYGQKETEKATSNTVTITVTDGTSEGGSEETEPSEDTYTVIITSIETTMNVGDSISLGATVQKNGETVDDATVTWTFTPEGGTAETMTGSTFTPTAAGTYTITATYTPVDDEPVTDTITIEVVEKDPIAGTEWSGTAYYDIATIGLETTLKSDVTLTVSEDGKFSLEIGNASATGDGLDLLGEIAAGIVNALLPDVDLSDMTYTRNGNEYTVHIYEPELGGDIYIYATYGEERGCEYLSVSFSITMEFGEYGEGSLTVTNQKVWKDGDEPAAVTGVEFDAGKEHVVTASALAGAFESELTFTVTDAGGESYPQAEWTGSQAWTSSDESVATVDVSGNITLTGTPGAVVITVTVDGCSASYVIVVGATEMAADDEIYGEWAGDASDFVVTYEGSLLGIAYSDDYTVKSSVGVAASANGITITLTIISATNTSEYESGAEIILYENATLYSAGGAYYVITIIDGVAYISEMKIVNGELSGTFVASTSFKVTSSRTYTGDIEFSATLEKLADARFAATTESATLTDGGSTADFENGEISLTVTSRNSSEVTYEIGGCAAVMTESQAKVFWNGVAGVGDAYVIITVTLVEGEAISWTSPDGQTKSYTYADLAEDGGVLEIIIRISGQNIGTEIENGSASYTISTGSTSVTHTVYFSDVEIPDVAEGKAMAVPSGADISFSGSDAVFNNREGFDIEYQENGVYVATGEANIMDGKQAEAYWSGVAAAGDAYIIVGICIEGGQTVYYGDKSWKKAGDDDLALIIRLVADANGTGSTVFTVKNAEGDTVAVFTVDYSQVIIPDVDESGTIVEDRIGLVPASESVTLTDEYINKSDSFANNDTLGVSLEGTDDGYVFVVTGTAEIMTSDQAEVFWNGVAEKGDAYVIIVVYLNVGETVSFGEKSWKKTGDDDLAIIVRLTAAKATSFVITDEEENEILSFVVDFSEVTIPSGGQLGRTAASTAGELLEAMENGAESVIILADMELGTSLEIERTLTLTLADGVTLSNAQATESGAHTVVVRSGAALTVEGTGKIDAALNNTAAIYVEEGATVYLNGGTFTRSNEAGTREWDETNYEWTYTEGENSWYTIYNKGTMVIDGAEITNTGAYSSMIDNFGTLTVTSGKLSGGLNTIKNEPSGQLIVTGGELSNATQAVIMNYGTFTADDGTFTQTNEYGFVVLNTANEAESAQRGITISGGTYIGTGADTVILIEAGTATISGGTFTGGLSTVMIYEDATVTISEGTFAGGTYDVIENYGTLMISGGTFTATAGGSNVIWNDGEYGYGEIEISGGTFKGATEAATIYTYCNGTIEISGGTFASANYSTTEGEITTYYYYNVLYAECGGSISVTGGIVGGWMNTNYGTISITGGYFTLDPSAYDGGNFVAEGYMAYGFTYGANDETYTMYGVIRSVAALEEGDTFADENFSLDNFEYHDIVINEDGSIEYQITATGGIMSTEQNIAFGGGDAQYSNEGDLYVSFKIWVNAGETISWTKDGEEMSETFEEAGWFVFVIRVDTSNLPEETESCSIGKRYFTISDEEGNSTTIIVNFGHIDIPEDYVLGGGVTDPSKEDGPEPTAHENSFSYTELEEKVQAAWEALEEGDSKKTYDDDGTTPKYDKYQLSSDMFDGSNSFISYVGNSASDVYRDSSNSSCIEIKGQGLQVTFEGTGTLTVTFRSTGKNNESTIALIDGNGNYIAGVIDESTIVEGTTVETRYLDSGSVYYYVKDANSNAGYVTITFNITEAGTYTIATSIEKSNSIVPEGGTKSVDDRATRIGSITMVDYYVDEKNDGVEG